MPHIKTNIEYGESSSSSSLGFCLQLCRCQRAQRLFHSIPDKPIYSTTTIGRIRRDPLKSLSSIGLSSGMTIGLQATGVFRYHWTGKHVPRWVWHPLRRRRIQFNLQLFGPLNMLNRVTGAIASNGPPIVTLPDKQRGHRYGYTARLLHLIDR